MFLKSQEIKMNDVLKTLPILYCGNDKVFDGILISLLSIIKYAKNPLDVFVMTVGLQDVKPEYKPVTLKQTMFLESVIQEANSQSKVHLVDVTSEFKQEMYSSPNVATSYTPYTLVRLFADMVPGMPERILYMDTDTVAHSDISSVFETDLTNIEFAAVRDYLGKIFIYFNYQNAGILYLNIDYIKKTGFFKEVRERCRSRKMWFPDQTALNSLTPKRKFLPRKYNEQRKLHDDTVIQHFSKSIRLFPYYRTVNVKPWQIDKMHSVFHLHEYDDILDEYSTLKKKYIS